VVCKCALGHLSMRLIPCSELFFAFFALVLRALRSIWIPCLSCFTMPSCCLTKCWGLPLLRRALRGEPVDGMGPEWAFERKKGWHSPIPVARAHSVIITSPSMLVEVSFEACRQWEKVLLTIFFFSLLIFHRLFFLTKCLSKPRSEYGNVKSSCRQQ